MVSQELHRKNGYAAPDQEHHENVKSVFGRYSAPLLSAAVLTLSEPKRHRNKEHLRFVARQPCLICARTPSDPHHLRFAQRAGAGPQGQRRIRGAALPRPTTAPCTGSATSRAGGRPPASIPSTSQRTLWGQSRLIEQTEPVAVPAAPEPFLVPPSQAARRDRRRSSKSSARGPANCRMP